MRKPLRQRTQRFEKGRGEPPAIGVAAAAAAAAPALKGSLPVGGVLGVAREEEEEEEDDDDEGGCRLSYQVPTAPPTAQ